MNIRDFIESKVAKQPDKPFLYFEDQVFTYQEFDQKINQAANGFLELGVRKGERVCLMLPNLPVFLFSWFGLAKIGAVMVPVNNAFRESEIAYLVNHSEAVGVLVASDNFLQVHRAKEKCPNLKWIACVESVDSDSSPYPFYDFFQTMPKELHPIDLKDHDVAQIVYTSGTTGFPKGAIHSHQNFVLAGEAFTVCADLGPSDKVMAILPLFHINAQYYSTMGALAAEADLILTRRFSATSFWEEAIKFGATEFNFIGAIGRILCNRPQSEFNPGHQIKTAYGALVTPDVYEVFTKRFKIKNVIDGYGLTETPRVCQNPINGTIKMKSIGLPAKHPDPDFKFSEVKILDEQGVELATGEKGEIVVRNPVMMLGYFKDEETTRNAIRNGWFHTGDLGYKDEDGYIFFLDRKKDIIRRKGENISATEVEMVINTHPKVVEAAIIAVESKLSEDEVMGCIVLRPNETLDPEEIIDWCRKSLAEFKVPRYIQFRDSLPKTATQRVAKYLLKKEKGLISGAHDMEAYFKKSKT